MYKMKDIINNGLVGDVELKNYSNKNRYLPTWTVFN